MENIETMDQKKNKRKTILIVVTAIFILLVLGLFLYLFFFSFKLEEGETKEINQNEISQEAEKSDDLSEDELHYLQGALQGNFEASDGLNHYTYTIEDDTIRIVAMANGKAMVSSGTIIIHKGYITVLYGSGKSADLEYKMENNKITYIAPLPKLVL